MLGGGYDRSQLIPLNPDGNTPSESGYRSVGPHKGLHEALNITNPKPGYHYMWVAKSRESLQRARNHGAVALKEGDEEVLAARERLDLEGVEQHTELDSVYSPFSDLIPMRMPLRNLRRMREEQDKVRQARFRGCGVEDEFVNRARRNPGEDVMQETSGRPTRFALTSHRSYVTAGPSPRDAEVDPQWAKISGIARENG